MNFQLKILELPNNIHNGSKGFSLNLNQISRIRTRTEGFINWDWTIEFKDGTKIELNSIDGERPLLHIEEDRWEYPIDDEGREFLNNLPSPEIDEEDELNLELEWKILMKNGKPMNMKLITHHEIHNQK